MVNSDHNIKDKIENKKNFQNFLISAFIYAIVVTIWGGSFIAIEFQLGHVNETVSVFYRYALSSIILISLVFLTKKPMFIFNIKDHLYFIIIGICFFSINYLFIYRAQNYLDSGITAITFTMCLFFTQVNSKIFLKTRFGLNTTLGGIIGVIGIVVIFLDSFLEQQFNFLTFIGIFYILIAAYIVSIATVATAKITKLGIPIIQASAWAMVYGTIINIIFIFLFQEKLILDPRKSYWISFFYLVFLASVIGFVLYFLLVKRIGPEKSSYFALMSPMIAIIISTIVEDLNISALLFLGTISVLIGNYIAIKR